MRCRPLDRNEDEQLELCGVHVLVVDDEQGARELFRDALTLAGARVSVASSGREAFALVERDSPDVLVSDIMMPGEDGYWLIENVLKLAQSYGTWRPRAVAIAITGDPVNHSRDRALRAGFDAHLSKPLNVDVLQATVRRLAGNGIAQGEWGRHRFTLRSEMPVKRLDAI
jgi:two-component system, chemotaxis family, CheB/CheR fusion protein